MCTEAVVIMYVTCTETLIVTYVLYFYMYMQILMNAIWGLMAVLSFALTHLVASCVGA